MALMLLAFLLVAAELFVPSHGILAIVAFLAALASVIMAFSVSAAAGVAFALVLLIATPVVFYWAIRIYPSTAVGRRVLLKNPLAAATDGFKDDTVRLEALLGRRGTAMTLLRPAGSVDIDGHRIDAVSESEMIAPGTPIEVLRISGRRVIVKPAPAE